MGNFVAIIRDGLSDFLVLKHFVTSIFQSHQSIELGDDNFYQFEDLKISNVLSKHLNGKETDFKTEIGSILFIAYNKLLAEKETVTNNDILILNADTEKILGSKDNYFEDWAYNVNNDIWRAIEEFYEKMSSQGYQYIHLPLILPLVLFPSSEILVASCMHDFNKENFRKLEAKPALKQKVYESDDIPTVLDSGHLQNVLDTFVVPDSLQHIYRELPEARKLLHILSFSLKS